MPDGPGLVVKRDAFGRRAVVEYHPRRFDRPSVTLPTVGDALKYAEEQSRETGLPVVDQTGSN